MGRVHSISFWVVTVIGITMAFNGCGGDEIEINDYKPGKEEIKPEPKPNPLVNPELAWNVTSLEVVINKAFDNPVLTNKNKVTVSFSSSAPDVATISSDGELKILAVGSATITASSEPTDKYEAQSTSFTLVVTKPLVDDGAGVIVFPSTGDGSSSDDISNTTFNRLITITFSTKGSATVAGDYHCYAKVDGNDVTVDSSKGDEFVVYKLTGATDNGSFKLYSQSKQAVILDGVSITNPSGAAVNIQSGKRTFILVENTNVLSDGGTAGYSSEEEDMKGVLFSEGQLVFSGDGSLTVKALNNTGKGGIVSDDYIRFLSSPTVKIEAGDQAGDGLKGKDYIRISDEKLDITTSGPRRKGIHSDGHVLVEGGETTVNVSGNAVYYKEEKEYKSSAGIKADMFFGMSGGTLDIINTGDGGRGINTGDLEYYQEHDDIEESFLSGGVLNVTTTGKTFKSLSPKGIKIGKKLSGGWNGTGRGNLIISGGNMNISSTYGEALEVKGTLTVSGGEHCLESVQDDAINSQNGIYIRDGFIYAYSGHNDVIDSNADLIISGGIVYAVTTAGVPQVALDAMHEIGKEVHIENGAVVILYGGIEPGAVLDQPCYRMNVRAGGYNALMDSEGKVIAVFKAPDRIDRLIVSAPGLSYGSSGVVVRGGYSKCYGLFLFPTSVNGGSASSLYEYVPTNIFDPSNIN